MRKTFNVIQNQLTGTEEFHYGLQNLKGYQSHFNDGLGELLEKLKLLLHFKGAGLMSPLRVPGELHLFVPGFVPDMPWIRLLSDALFLLGSC